MRQALRFPWGFRVVGVLLPGQATSTFQGGILQLPGGSEATRIAGAGRIGTGITVALGIGTSEVRIGNCVGTVADGGVAPVVQTAVGHRVQVDVVPDVVVAPLQQGIQTHHRRPVVVRGLEMKGTSSF